MSPSSILHGLWILLFTIPFAGLIDEIPTAALAGLLIVIGIQLLKPAHIETAMKHGDLAVYVVTAVCVVFLNLLHGVMIGLALAIALTGWRVIQAKVEAEQVGDEWYVSIEGACTFLALPRLTRVLASIPPGKTVTVEISASYLDHAAHQSITDWERQQIATGGSVAIHGLSQTGRLGRRGTSDASESDERPEAA
jgi:carbonic anhydrase